MGWSKGLSFDLVIGRILKDNCGMVVSGKITGGVVVLDEPGALPEGMSVSVHPRSSPMIRAAKKQRRVVLPLFPSDKPGSVALTNDRIAEILQDQDASS